jgi:hypothetical protein
VKYAATTYHGFSARSVLEARYPDLSDYFQYLTTCSATQSNSKQHRQFLDPRRKCRHHICPRAQFPEYDKEPDNLIRITVEQHIHAHDLLSIAIPELYVEPSFIAASIRLKSAHQRKAKMAAIRNNPDHDHLAGRCAAAVNKRNRTSVYSREIQLKGASAGGKVTGPTSGAAALARYRTPEHQSWASRCANHKRYHSRHGNPNTCARCKKKRPASLLSA